METQTQNIIRNYYSKLPRNVQQVLTQSDLRSRLLRVSQTNHLRTDDAAVVEDEVVLVLLGLEHPNDLILNLKHQLKLQAPQLQNLVKNINQEIFTPIRSSLLSLHEKHKDRDVISKEQKRGDGVSRVEPKKSQPPHNLPGVERTMPSDVLKARFSGQTHSAPHQENKTGDAKPYTSGDPYREPIE